MKKQLFKFWFTGLIMTFLLVNLHAQTAIGVESAEGSARLELSSSSKGFLMPRMTQSQRNAILSPSNGLLVFQTDNTSGFYYYQGSAWTGPLTSTEVDGLIKSNGISVFSASLNLGNNKISNVGEPSGANDIATKAYTDGLSGGLLWRESVLNLVSSAPSTPSSGDRYILSASWGGGTVGQIATYNGSNWSFSTPSAKDAVFVTIPSNGYVYNGTQWLEFNSGTIYSFTGGLTNSGNTISLSAQGIQTNHIANGAITAAKINSMSASSGQLLVFNGTSWAPSSANSGTVTSMTGGTGISVSNGSTTPTVNIGTVGLSAGGTNSNTGSITGTSALAFAASGTNNSVTMTPSGSGYTILNGKVGLGVSSPTTRLHIQNSNTYSGNPSSNDAPTLQIFNTNNTSTSANSMMCIRTAGNSSGNPYLSWDLNMVKGNSIGIDNSTDRLIINGSWDFNLSSNSYKLVQFNTSGQSRVLITDVSGNIKTNWPSGWGGGLCTWDLSVSGIYYSVLTSMSDLRLKNTVRVISNELANKYMQLNPVTYYWNEDIFKVRQLNYGFISQEVEEIFPDMVLTATDEMQTKSMNYQSMLAMHVKMIQKHNADLTTLNEINQKQEQEIQELKRALTGK